eukprot:scaffold43078_cov44-Tisochrysis_lutea.AAC.3
MPRPRCDTSTLRRNSNLKHQSDPAMAHSGSHLPVHLEKDGLRGGSENKRLERLGRISLGNKRLDLPAALLVA